MARSVRALTALPENRSVFPAQRGSLHRVCQTVAINYGTGMGTRQGATACAMIKDVSIRLFHIIFKSNFSHISKYKN